MAKRHKWALEVRPLIGYDTRSAKPTETFNVHLTGLTRAQVVMLRAALKAGSNSLPDQKKDLGLKKGDGDFLEFITLLHTELKQKGF